MRTSLLPLTLTGVLALGICRPPAVYAEAVSEPTTIPGVDPTPVREEAMTSDKLVDFFEHQKKGTPLELTLDKGKVVKGLFSSYDDYYDSIWLVPVGEQGMFTEKSYKVSGIRHVALWDRKTSPKKEDATTFETIPSPSDDYILMKQEGAK